MADRFVGRDRELDALAAILADSGTPVAEVAGEPGIGKSRLLREFAALVTMRGYRAIYGRATQYERTTPFDMLAHAGVIPDLSGGTLPEERHLLYRAIGTLLEQASAEAQHGLVLLLDDMHWADSETIQWLRYFLRRPLPPGVRLVLAHRDKPLPAELAATLAQARDDEVATRVALRPLTQADAMELGADETTYHASGGNPLYLLTLRGTSGDGLRSAVLAEAGTLPNDARLLAQAAAVAGDPFDLALTAAIAQLPDTRAREALDMLAACGLVHRESGRFTFRHPLVREIIYDGAGEGWLIGAHARALAVLRSMGRPVTQLACHAERCGRPGDAALLAEAGRAVLPHAPRTAAHWLGTALRLVPADDLRLDLAYALSVSGQFDRGWEVLAPLMNQPRVLLLASALERHLGRAEGARHALQDAVRTEPSIQLLIELCYHHLMRGDITDHARCANDALQLARVHGDQPHEAAALAQLALAGLATGNVAAAREYRDQAAAIVDYVPDRDLTDLDALCHLASAELHLELPTQARAHVDRVTLLARATGRGVILLQAATLNALALRQVGDIDAAWRHADDALEMARSTGSDRWRLTVLVLRGELAVIRGDLHEAIASGTKAMRLATTPADRWLARHVPMVLAVAAFFTGRRDDRAGQIEQILRAYGGPDLPLLDASSRVRVYETLTWMASLCPKGESPAIWSERTARACDGSGLCTAEGFAHLARAEAAMLTDPRQARRHARAAVTAFRRAGARYEAARALLADALAAGEPAALAEAQAALTECGAALPAGMDPATAALSPRERQVVELVASGHTNRRIARELGISEKTVETHMARIFTKLGVSSRAMVATAVSRGFP